jgi:hypothetical protein
MTMRIPLLLAALSLCGVTAEIRSFSGVIEASSSYIHYSDGYLVAPGYVDISGLTFRTIDYVPDEELADDEVGEEGDDDIGDDVGPEDGGSSGGGGGRKVDADLSDQGSDGSVVSGRMSSEFAWQDSTTAVAHFRCLSMPLIF